jgi:pimeloyl-ACP methyl ester carboxylesterase
LSSEHWTFFAHSPAGAEIFVRSAGHGPANPAVNVREAVVPNSGHWLMEESPAYTVNLIRDYLKDPTAATHK